MPQHPGSKHNSPKKKKSKGANVVNPRDPKKTVEKRMLPKGGQFGKR